MRRSFIYCDYIDYFEQFWLSQLILFGIFLISLGPVIYMWVHYLWVLFSLGHIILNPITYYVHILVVGPTIFVSYCLSVILSLGHI